MQNSTVNTTMTPLAPITPKAAALPFSRIIQTWWPLAIGWVIMTAELPLLASAVARSANPEINLAAWGLVFPKALILSSPIMMLLAASTTLSKDWDSYRKLRSFMRVLVLLLSGIHLLLAFTPLYDWLVRDLIAAPPELLEPARLGFRIMLPWSASLAFRRFNYGVLIRFGHTRAVTMGAVTRLAVDMVILAIFAAIGTVPGIVVATATITLGVVGEAIYSGLRVAPIIRNELRAAEPIAEVLTRQRFLYFYIPLVMTSLIQILVQPIGSAALSRMPMTIESLAVWPVVHGLVILMGSAGTAFTEAVVVLLDHDNALESLYRFTLRLGLGLSGILLIMNITPLADLWFRHIAALPEALIPLAHAALWLTTIMPLLTTFQSLYQGMLLNVRQTRGITESVLISLLVTVLILVGGIVWGEVNGIYIGMAALTVGGAVRNGWLWMRTRPVLAQISAR